MIPQAVFYAAIFGLMLVGLSVNVVRMRKKVGVDIGVGADESLARAVRSQGNFIEYVPLALLLMAMGEAAGMPSWAVHLSGIVLLASRIAHAYSLLMYEPAHAHLKGMPRYLFRMVGQGGTLTVLVVLSTYLLVVWMIG